MFRCLPLLLLLASSALGSWWPTATLVEPANGILIVGEGRTASISFNLNGDPFPRDIRWFKDGRQISSSASILIDTSGGNIHKIQFNSVSRNDEGTYYVIVKDIGAPEASKSPEVKVKVSYLEDAWDTSTNQVVDARLGEFAVLECRPPAFFGATQKFAWTKGSVPITESDSMYVAKNGDLVILQVAYQHSGSDYRCSITIDSLKEGEQTRQGPAVSLQVISNSASYISPQIAVKPTDTQVDAQIRETFRVECVVNGYPDLPNIRWYKDSVPITASSVIYDIQKRNYLGITIPRSGGTVGGTYRCEAYDRTNTVGASANIQIYTKPIITTGLPTSEVKKSSGSELDLACGATSTPSPSYRWFKNAILLTDNINTHISGESLTVTNINTMNKGVYQCEAYNDQGSTISTGMIVIQERLTFVIRPQDVEVYLGTAATFNCMGKGNPGPKSLQWKFNGGDPPASHVALNNVENQATYTIPLVTTSEKDGRISCIISSPENLHPTDTATAILTLREGPQVNAHVQSIVQQEGLNVDLVCTVHNADPNTVTWKWLFGDTLLTEPEDERITLTPGLLQIRQISAADEGTYTCQALDDGLSNQDTIYLKVETRPKITLDSSIRVGQDADANLVCVVSGNPQPDITWKRNSVDVPTGTSKYTIDNSIEGQSTLTVRNVDKNTDVGDYVCYGENKIGKMKETIELIVVADCEVMELPKNQTTDFGESITISCTVNDCPTATWTWKNDGNILSFDGFTRINRGDSIVLTKVAPSDGGVYSCTVNSNNNLNKEETYSATITVEAQAKLTQYPPSRVLYKEGDRVKMTCAARGDNSAQPLTIEWYKAESKLEAATAIDTDYNERMAYATSILTKETAIASDAGHYYCIASNQYSTDRRDTSLMLMTNPDRPGQPYSTWTGVGAVELAWREPPNTGNTPLTSYELHIVTDSNPTPRQFLKDLDPQRVNTIIYFLSENQEYTFKVVAVNEVGQGLYSLPSNKIRTIKTISYDMNLVEEFQLTPISSDSIRVTWKMPERRNTALRGYKIVYRNEDKKENPKFLIIDDYTVLEATIEDLDAGALYSVQVESNTGVSVDLVVSSAQTTNTFNQRPTPPIECEANRETSSLLVVSWSIPENTHGKVLEYTIYYRAKHYGLGGGSDEEWTSVVQTDPQTTTYAVQVSDGGVDYNVKVTASNSAGEGLETGCSATGMIIQMAWYATWWFYLIIALVILFLIIIAIVCVVICCRNKAEKGPKMKKLPPASGNKDDFPTSPKAQVYSPNAPRNYTGPSNTQMNTFSGPGTMTSPYGSPEPQPKFGAGDFSYGAQPPKPDYSYNGNKFNTYDSRATYNDPPKSAYNSYNDQPSYPNYDPAPKSPYPAYDPAPKSPPRANYGGYNDRGSNYENNTYDSRYRDNGSRGGGYPPFDRNPSYGGGGSGGNFKSSQL